MAERHPLTLLPSALTEAGFETVTYRAAWTAAVDGRIPARRNPKGRSSFAADDLPEIAAALSLTDAHAA